MKRSGATLVEAVLVALALARSPVLATEKPESIPLKNWAVPAHPSGGIHSMADVTVMLPFVAITPCRVADTRVGSGFGGAFGAPALAANAVRTFPMLGQCGVPVSNSGGLAVSVNVTVTNTQGPGDLRVFPDSTTPPLVSTLNYLAGQTIANAAIVPVGFTGVSLLPDVSGTDVIIDVNGYFATASTGGSGLYVTANVQNNPAIYAFNGALTCGGACGISGQIRSNVDGANAAYGSAESTTGRNYGVVGYSFGLGSGGTPPVATEYSAGVYGKAFHTTTNTAGVMGETLSSGAFASGVLGISNNSAARGATFHNASSGTFAAMAFLGVGLSTNGSVFANSLSVSGTKSFVSPHPEDPSKEIKYVSVEAPTADVYFRGTGHLVNGIATIAVPEHFRLTAREGSYMTTLTPVGETVALAVLREDASGIVVQGRRDVAFHYVVYAERDVLRDHEAVQDNVDFTPAMIANVDLLRNMPERMRALLVKNGTLNSDGTFNEATARRAGWTLPASGRR